MSKALNETFARQSHERWCHWMKYLFSKCIVNIDGSVTIPISLTSRWIRQMNTTYCELSEDEKKSDLKEGIRFVELLKMIGLIKDEK